MLETISTSYRRGKNASGSGLSREKVMYLPCASVAMLWQVGRAGF